EATAEEQSSWSVWRERHVQSREAFTEEKQLRLLDAKKQNPRLEFVTGKGKFVIELYEDDAPNTVANMVKLAKDGAFDGKPFETSGHGFVSTTLERNAEFELRYEASGRRIFADTVGCHRNLVEGGRWKSTHSTHFRFITQYHSSMTYGDDGARTFIS